MIIGDERRRIHLTRISQNKGVYITKDDDWSSHEEKDLLPPFIRILREILIEAVNIGQSYLDHVLLTLVSSELHYDSDS